MGGVRPESAGDLVRSAPWQSLRLLMLLRNIAIAGQATAIAVVHEFFSVPSPLTALVSLAGLLILLNLAVTSWRLRQPRPVTDLEVLAQIGVDIGALATLLYLSGGAANPFAGMFLMPLAIAAASLPWTHTAIVALLTAACYLLLVFIHVPLPAPGEGAREFLVLATWINYLLCAGLIAYLVLALAGRLREQGRRLAEVRRSAPAQEYLARVGSLAAGAAHEIRSPLCTLAVLVEEMQQQGDGAVMKRNLRIMSDQIEVCRRTLADLMPETQGAPENERQSADEFLRDVVSKFRALRPGVRLSYGQSGSEPPPTISAERNLGRAILNLLNNAADVSPEAVAMNCAWSASDLRICVEDRGPGIPPELGEVLGQGLFTTKGDRGTGIGLLLARTAVLRAGGDLRLFNLPGGGARAEVVLPLEQAKAPAAGPALRTDPEGALHGARR